jgi:hypothetical protein
MQGNTTIDGTLYEFSEMGGRGTPVWTISAGNDFYRIKSGDLLTVFGDAARKKVVWQGEVDLVATGAKYPAPDLTQANLPKKDWRKFFKSERPAQVTCKAPEKITW